MPAHRKDYDQAVAMYESGLSIGDVAELHGVTRQAMWKILRRRGVVLRPQLRLGAQNHFYTEGVEYDKRVHGIVTKAIARGRLIREPCEICGANDTEAHHDDYNKPLSVRWLCPAHHREWHSRNKPIRRTVELPPMPHRDIASMGGRAPRRK